MKETTRTSLANASGWQLFKLGDLLQRHNDIIHPGDRKDGEAVFVGLEHIEPHTGRRTGSLKIDLSKLTGRKPTFRAGQIVYGYLRPYLNKVWVAEFDGCSSVDQFAFDVRRELADTTFLAAFMRSESFLHRSEVVTTTGQLPRISIDEIEAVQIELPPLDEQKRFAAELTVSMAATDKARRAAQERLAAAEALPAAYLREVFEGPEACEWETVRLGDVLIPHKEIIHPGDRQSGTAEFVGLEHVESHTGRRLGSLPLDLARLTGRKPTFRRGQIVYGYLRPYLNKVWLADFDGCSSVDQFAYGVRTGLADARFVAWFMRSPTYMHRSAIVTTTGQLPRIGTSEIAAVEIGLPPLDRQRSVADEIERRFAAWRNLVDLLQAEAHAIDALLAALLRDAFTTPEKHDA